MTAPKFLTTLVLSVMVASFVFAGEEPESAFNKDPWPAAKEGPVKVFILAGQSNMQGHAALRTLEYLIYNEETADEYQQWKDRYGDWYERKDVWIWTTDGERYGNLKPGYGSSSREMGPELGFGWVAGKHFDEQVLIIKTCWGGRSVKKDFLPPSAEQPTIEMLQADLERRQRKNPDATIEEVKEGYGKAYRDTVEKTKYVLKNMKELFPGYDESRGYEIAGIVFFQGWNDMVDGQQREEKYATYTKRLQTMIKDLRKDLNAPNVPFVIAELGVGGERGDFQKAQAAAADLPEFKGNVTALATDVFWDKETEEILNKDYWKTKDWVKFYNIGSERGYHYLGSAKILYGIGKAMGDAMIELNEKK